MLKESSMCFNALHLDLHFDRLIIGDMFQVNEKGPFWHLTLHGVHEFSLQKGQLPGLN